MRLSPEMEYGNIEYKWKLHFSNTKDFEKRKTQMAFRIEEGDGIAFYFLGVMDDGLPVGLRYNDLLLSETNLIKLADSLNLCVLFIENIPTISTHHHARKYKILKHEHY